jgi:RIO kinase 1
LYRLAAAGVRVPKPHNFHEGVLLMELVTDSEGNAAPRLNDLLLTAELSREYHRTLITQVVRMLCAGIIHGDLSEYNVLVDSTGPVVIDLPQAINAAANNQARKMLLRDVDNLATYFGRFAPELLTTNYGMEIWSLYESSQLHPETVLTGYYERIENPVDMNSVMREINDTLKEEEARQLYRTLRLHQ